MPNPREWKRIKNYKEEVHSVILSKTKKGFVKIPGWNWNVLISKKGIAHLMNESDNRLAIATAKFIPEILQNSIFCLSEDELKSEKIENKQKVYHKFASLIRVGKEIYPVKITIKQLIYSLKDISYYHHELFELDFEHPWRNPDLPVETAKPSTAGASKNHLTIKTKNLLEFVKLKNEISKTKLIKKGKNMNSQIATIVKSTLAIINQLNSDEIEILKAKRRKDGETWTQPSGRRVTKKGGKIIPVSTRKENKVDSKEKSTSGNAKRFSDDELNNTIMGKEEDNESENEKQSQKNNFRRAQKYMNMGKNGELNNDVHRLLLKNYARRLTPKQVQVIKDYKIKSEELRKNERKAHSDAIEARMTMDRQTNVKKTSKNYIPREKLKGDIAKTKLEYEKATIARNVLDMKTMGAIMGSKNLRNEIQKKGLKWDNQENNAYEFLNFMQALHKGIADIIKVR